MTILYLIGILYLCPLLLCLLLIKLVHKLGGYSVEEVRGAIYMSLVPVLNVMMIPILIIFLLILIGIYTAVWAEVPLGWFVDRTMKIMGVK